MKKKMKVRREKTNEANEEHCNKKKHKMMTNDEIFKELIKIF